jgi:hypothetical protein
MKEDVQQNLIPHQTYYQFGIIVLSKRPHRLLTPRPGAIWLKIHGAT